MLIKLSLKYIIINLFPITNKNLSFFYIIFVIIFIYLFINMVISYLLKSSYNLLILLCSIQLKFLFLTILDYHFIFFKVKSFIFINMIYVLHYIAKLLRSISHES